MRTIRRGGEYEIEIKKSRFLCAMERVDSEEAARAFIDERRKEHWNATHNCTAYVLGEDGTVQRSSDDGEPGGTAGVPMLEVLRHRGLTDTVAVVTRYFGGTKLGTGGLVRAYTEAAQAVLAGLPRAMKEDRRRVALAIPYNFFEPCQRLVEAQAGEIAARDFGAEVRLTVDLPAEAVAAFAAEVAEATGVRVRVGPAEGG